MKKRLLSALLCLCMMLTMTPAAFAAEDTDGTVAKVGDTGYSSLSDAVSNAVSGSTIVMQADV